MNKKLFCPNVPKSCLFYIFYNPGIDSNPIPEFGIGKYVEIPGLVDRDNPGINIDNNPLLIEKMTTFSDVFYDARYRLE